MSMFDTYVVLIICILFMARLSIRLVKSDDIVKTSEKEEKDSRKSSLQIMKESFHYVFGKDEPAADTKKDQPKKP